VLDSGKRRELFLKLHDLRTHDPLAAFDRRLDCAIERFAEPATLGL
jgi:hypothetical protein